MSTVLRLTGEQLALLDGALYTGDEREAVAFALCGRTVRDRDTFTVRHLHFLDHSIYLERKPDLVRWRTDDLPQILSRAEQEGLWILKLHSHPGGWPEFSRQDDRSDAQLAEVADSWLGPTGRFVLSALVLPRGVLRGRTVDPNGVATTIDAIDIVGDDLRFERAEPRRHEDTSAATAQAFGSGTLAIMQRLRVAVVGCSGTGSVVVEQLARTGIGTLILVDPDVVEHRNLNRIVNATEQDAELRTPKVEVMRRAIAAMGTGTKVETLATSLFRPEAIRAVSKADILFGCVDTVDARHLLCQIGAFYLLPYFDIGVKLEADGRGGVEQVCCSVHYIRPGGGSLLSRGVYSLDEVRAAGLLRSDPTYLADQVARGYLRGVQESRPAVISVNMLAASLAVNDLLARLHPYRLEGNESYAAQRVSLSHDLFDHEADGAACTVVGRGLGKGDVEPLLDQPEFSEPS